MSYVQESEMQAPDWPPEIVAQIARLGPPIIPQVKKPVLLEWSQFKEVHIVSYSIILGTVSSWKFPQSLGGVSWFDNPHLLIHLLNGGLRLHREEIVDASKTGDAISALTQLDNSHD